MKTLDQIACYWGTDKASWGHNYTTVYTPIMESRRFAPVKILELGWGVGSSAATWLEYFPNAEVVVVDDRFSNGWVAYCPAWDVATQDPGPEFWTNPRLHRYPGDQCSQQVCKDITDKFGLFDYIIDDASHDLSKTMGSFHLWWPWVLLGGHYFIEDISGVNLRGEIGVMLDSITDTQSITLYPSPNPLDPERIACIQKGTHMVTEYCETPEWMRVPVQGGRYSFEVPTFMQPHAHMFENWERERFESMQKHLNRGDVFYDVGAEMGWMSLIYAQLVGAENMVLIEPSEAAWPNIRQTWERNLGEDREPLAAYRGFMGDVTNDTSIMFEPWPDESFNAPLLVSISYKYLWESADTVPQMTLDDFIARSGHHPRAINIDVEGAELQVLRGAEQTLKFSTNPPLLWVSIHPDLMMRWYSTTEDEVHEFMASCGYSGEHLATDHESHWRFWH